MREVRIEIVQKDPLAQEHARGLTLHPRVVRIVHARDALQVAKDGDEAHTLLAAHFDGPELLRRNGDWNAYGHAIPHAVKLRVSVIQFYLTIAESTDEDPGVRDQVDWLAVHHRTIAEHRCGAFEQPADERCRRTVPVLPGEPRAVLRSPERLLPRAQRRVGLRGRRDRLGFGREKIE